MIGGDDSAAASVCAVGLASSVLPAVLGLGRLAFESVGPVSLGVVLGADPVELGLIPRDRRVELALAWPRHVRLRLGALGGVDLVVELDRRGRACHSIVFGLKKVARPGCGGREIGWPARRRERVGHDAEAPDGRRRGRPLDVAARLLHRLSWPTSIPMACGVPRESRNDSEPLTGTRAGIRVRSWSACSIRTLVVGHPALFLGLDRQRLRSS